MLSRNRGLGNEFESARGERWLRQATRQEGERIIYGIAVRCILLTVLLVSFHSILANSSYLSHPRIFLVLFVVVARPLLGRLVY